MITHNLRVVDQFHEKRALSRETFRSFSVFRCLDMILAPPLPWNNKMKHLYLVLQRMAGLKHKNTITVIRSRSILQELVEDVAVATSSRHADLSWARRFAVASPRFIGRRSASTVLLRYIAIYCVIQIRCVI